MGGLLHIEQELVLVVFCGATIARVDVDGGRLKHDQSSRADQQHQS